MSRQRWSGHQRGRNSGGSNRDRPAGRPLNRLPQLIGRVVGADIVSAASRHRLIRGGRHGGAGGRRITGRSALVCRGTAPGTVVGNLAGLPVAIMGHAGRIELPTDQIVVGIQAAGFQQENNEQQSSYRETIHRTTFHQILFCLFCVQADIKWIWVATFSRSTLC
jgi:hypothetical protein